MNDFASLVRADRDAEPTVDLIDLSLRLAGTPCGPLYDSHVSPDRELLAYASRHNGQARPGGLRWVINHRPPMPRGQPDDLAAHRGPVPTTTGLDSPN